MVCHVAVMVVAAVGGPESFMVETQSLQNLFSELSLCRIFCGEDYSLCSVILTMTETIEALLLHYEVLL